MEQPTEKIERLRKVVRYYEGMESRLKCLFAVWRAGWGASDAATCAKDLVETMYGVEHRDAIVSGVCDYESIDTKALRDAAVEVR
jgi:hypothetical protein